MPLACSRLPSEIVAEQVSKAELTSNQREDIRQTVMRELNPLRSFQKAHSHSGVMQHHHTPVKPPPKAPSVDFNMSYVPTSPLAALPSLPGDSTSVWAGTGGHTAHSQRRPLTTRASEDSVRSLPLHHCILSRGAVTDEQHWCLDCLCHTGLCCCFESPCEGPDSLHMLESWDCMCGTTPLGL